MTPRTNDAAAAGDAHPAGPISGSSPSLQGRMLRTRGRRLVAIVSFRLGSADGMSVAAAHWAVALRRLGYRVRAVAGTGVADRLVPGLAIDAPLPSRPRELDAALGAADLVVAENICSLPLNPNGDGGAQQLPAGPAADPAPPRPARAATPLRPPRGLAA